MECPKCNAVIYESSHQCESCGYMYEKQIHEKISFYFDLKNELEHLRSIAKNELWTGIHKISKRIEDYEKLINTDLNNAAVLLQDKKELRTESVPPVITDTKKAAAPAHAQHNKIPVKEAIRTQPISEGKSSDFEIRMGQKWLLIIGIITMVFGVGYFLKYSFEQGWVGPAGRVAMAYVWGIIFLISGDRFRKKFETFGLYLIGGGIATLYFSTFAAFQIYHLLDQTPSFLIMVLITVLASTLSIVYDTKWLAVLGLIGGFFTPVLLSTGQDNQMVLMIYMTILNLGLLGVAFYKRWDLLNILGFVFTYILYAGWFYQHYAESKFWPAIIFLNVFYFIYCIIPFIYQFFRAESEKIKGFLIIIPNSFIAFGFSYFMIKEYFSLEWVSVITVLYAVVFLLMATYLYRQGKYHLDAFVILLAKATLFLIITIPIIFSKHWITIFWAAQALTLLWMGIRLERRSLIGSSYFLFGIATGKFLVYDYETVFKFNSGYFYITDSYTYLLTERLITSVFLLTAFYISAHIAKKASLKVLSSSKDAVSSTTEDSSVIFAVWGILLFVVLNIEASSFFHDYLLAARFAAISVLWTLFSVGLMIKGFQDNNPIVRKVSLGLFLGTIIKVFLFDMSNISTPYRIVSFIILGMILVSTSYLYHKFKDKIMDAIASPDKKEQ